MTNTLKSLIIIIIVGYSNLCNSQKNTDIDFIFKTWLYLEHINESIPSNNEYKQKDSNVFSLFVNSIKLKIDHLECEGFSNDYVFVAINGSNNRNSDSSIKYNETEFLNLLIIPRFCNRYVLCVNKLNGKSYRLQGFAGNDILTLIKDIRKQRLFNNKKFKLRQFFKSSFVSGLDLKCLYKGIKSFSLDDKKYPCLEDCRGSDEIIWIH